MAYVYVQHLSPDHESFLPEILERKTKMPVLKTEHNMRIEKDHVYVIPESTFITVTDGVLQLEKRKRNENFFPIDSFSFQLLRFTRKMPLVFYYQEPAPMEHLD